MTIYVLQTKAEADAVPGPKETEHALEFGQWLWRVRTGTDMGPTAAQLLAELYVRAKALLTADDEISKKEKAVLLVILDEFNGHATKINAILNAIDASSNHATLKTNIAAIADYPQRTAAQIKTSVSDKIDAGQANG